jgi:hypothetical protein
MYKFKMVVVDSRDWILLLHTDVGLGDGHLHICR